jgi:acyl-CoA thioester hydrolase
MGADRFVMQFRIVSQTMQKTVAEGDGLIVSYNYREGHKAPIPAAIRQRIEALEGRSFSLLQQ